MFDSTIFATKEINLNPLEGNNKAIATSQSLELDPVSTQLSGSQVDDNYVQQTVELWESSAQSLAETYQTGPDLIIGDITAPTTIKAGTLHDIDYTLTNQGDVSLDYFDSSNTYFYLSTDTTLDDGDTYLDYDYNWNGLGAGTSRTYSQYISFDSSLAGGTYYLFAYADAGNDITEANENNNIAYQEITIALPDLVIDDITAPTTIKAGTLHDIDYTLTNQGNVSIDYFDSSNTYFYLSTDTTLDDGDTYLDYDYNWNGLDAGISRNYSQYISFDSSLAGGTYYLFAYADGGNDITEANENNNIAYQKITITNPDLIISNLTAPTTIEAGTSHSINYTLTNQGDVSIDYLDSSNTYFYLSTDTTLDDGDTYLDYDYNWNGLEARTSSNYSEYVSFDVSLAGGTYYLLASADGGNDITESNENNNVAYQQITIIEAQVPDFVITNLSVPDSVTAGSNFNFSYTISNNGNVASQSWIGESVYLSTDEILDDSDLTLTTDYYRGSLGVGESNTVSSEVYLDIMAPGTYYVFIEADHYDFVDELNEDNNIAVATLTINPAVDAYSMKSGYGLINAAAAVAEAVNQQTFADVPDLGGDYWGADLVNAPEVWNAGYTGKDVVVAVLDTGVDRYHDDLKDNIWTNSGEIAGNGIDDDGNGFIDDVYGWNFVSDINDTLDVQSHGTHVAGTIAGVNNDFGVTGIAYDAQIMPVKVLGDDGSGSYEGVAQGIIYAADNGADVINMSLGGPTNSDVVREAVEYAANKGVIVVSAAGNDGRSTTMGSYPAAYAADWGLTVGAVNYNNKMASFSNRAGETKLSYITAPGVSVLSTTPNNRYDSYSGTSMAAPHVAGVVALMLEANPNLTDAQVRQIMATASENSQFIG